MTVALLLRDATPPPTPESSSQDDDAEHIPDEALETVAPGDIASAFAVAELRGGLQREQAPAGAAGEPDAFEADAAPAGLPTASEALADGSIGGRGARFPVDGEAPDGGDAFIGGSAGPSIDTGAASAAGVDSAAFDAAATLRIEPPDADSDAETAALVVGAAQSDRPAGVEEGRAGRPVVLDVFADSSDGIASAIARAAEEARERDRARAQADAAPADEGAPGAPPEAASEPSTAASTWDDAPQAQAGAGDDGSQAHAGAGGAIEAQAGAGHAVEAPEGTAIDAHAPPPDDTLTEGFPAAAPDGAHVSPEASEPAPEAVLSPDLPVAMPFMTPPPQASALEAFADLPLDALLARAARGAEMGLARAELARRAERNLAPLLALFPGPLEQDRHRSTDRLPPASLCGPLLQAFALAGARGAATVAVLARHDDVDVRFWAAHLLGEIPSPEAADGLLAFVVDADPAVRRVALRSAGAILLASLPGRPLEAALGYLARDPHTPLRERLAAIEAMGQLRVPFFVPMLVGLLSSIPEEVGESARRALLIVTRQDFGRDAARWNEWWARNELRHRVEWLIDSLMHETQSIRRAAGDELKQLTKEYFGYYDDLPKRERERAQDRYREWWEREGRGRFR
ncbi:MAG: HEAT repeat domain-containing protein [Polyangiaceae bacterium]